MNVDVNGTGKYKKVQVREKVIDPITGKSKYYVVKNLGRYEDLYAQDPDFLVKLRAEYKKKTVEAKQAGAPIMVALPSGTIENPADALPTLNIGHAVIARMWDIMGLDSFIENHIDKKNKERIRNALYYLCSRRCSNPDSILACHSNMSNYAGVERLPLDILYEVLDVLKDHKDELIDHLCALFKKKTKRRMDTVAYDVTNYYFESQKTGQLRYFGFSKEHRSDCVIVVMGLLIDSNGIPVTFEMFDGNTMDQSTLVDSTERLKELYGFDEITVVADRGMNSGSNLIYLSDKGHHFVISYTLKKSNDELKALALDNDTWDVVKYESNSNIISYASKRISHKVTAKVKMSDEEIEEEKLKRADIKSRGRLPKYKEVEVPAVIHITYDARRAKKDYHDCMVSILKLQEKLKYPSRIDSEMRRGQNQWLKKSGSNFELDDEKIAEAEKWDGIYAIITDRQELTTEEVASIYGGQWKIEESFRILKSDLEARPSFVWTQDHIIGHFTLCFLSLSIIRYMQYLLSKGSDNVISAERILTAVNTTTAVVLSSKGTKILVPNNVSQDFIDIAAQLGMKKLEKAMTFVRFRTLTGLHLEANYNFLREFF